MRLLGFVVFLVDRGLAAKEPQRTLRNIETHTCVYCSLMFCCEHPCAGNVDSVRTPLVLQGYSDLGSHQKDKRRGGLQLDRRNARSPLTLKFSGLTLLPVLILARYSKRVAGLKTLMAMSPAPPLLNCKP